MLLDCIRLRRRETAKKDASFVRITLEWGGGRLKTRRKIYNKKLSATLQHLHFPKISFFGPLPSVGEFITLPLKRWKMNLIPGIVAPSQILNSYIVRCLSSGPGSCFFLPTGFFPFSLCVCVCSYDATRVCTYINRNRRATHRE